ncbi:MAG: NAD(P)-dependent oxidoreductase [Rhodospirillaceae bacterium]|jgi:3-hydroxyisobutyrate dehydrogenase-like beta-hydroxyacid dehydrogenase|nr:NAD(P)-dependent oxidoreductase [Rhodospirillaceae bacterium]MBT7267862.1 NAD(P)-dependent oxidoreductase [Rhodospirillaceae bacterium]
MSEKIGMIGLGKMGLALARQMRIDGHELFGYDNDPERMKLFEGEGGTPVASSKILAEKCDITFSILLQPEHIEENTTGPNGIAQAGKEGLIHVEMSTMPPAFQIDLAEKLSSHGIELLDAPISGSHNKVDDRIITFMVGGKDNVFGRVRPIIEPLAKATTHTGDIGSGSAMKVVTNLYVNSVTALMAEMVVLGERAGLSHATMEECLGAGSVRGEMWEVMRPRFFNRDFAPRGAVEIFAKDMGIAIDLAKEHGLDLQVVPAARKMFQRAEAAGWAKDDASRVLEVYEGKDLG